MIKAVIFDMDGVIVDSEPIHMRAEKETLLNYGIQISSEELLGYTGTTTKFMYGELIKKHKIKSTIEKLSKERDQAMFRLLEENTPQVKGVNILIESLRDKNLKLGLASSSSRALISLVLQKLNFESFFDSVMGAEDISHSKPNPEIFFKSAESLDKDPNTCLVIEDSKFGVLAAKNAGMKCIGYKNPNSGNQDLSKADLIIDSFSELNVQDLIEL